MQTLNKQELQDTHGGGVPEVLIRALYNIAKDYVQRELYKFVRPFVED